MVLLNLILQSWCIQKQLLYMKIWKVVSDNLYFEDKLASGCTIVLYRGGAEAQWLVFWTLESSCLGTWANHFTLTVPLYTQV